MFFPVPVEDEFVDALVYVGKVGFAFFQQKVKSVFCHPAKLCNVCLGEGQSFQCYYYTRFIGK